MLRLPSFHTLIVALLALAAAGTGRALAEPNLLLSYDIYYGGIAIMQLDARLDLAEEGQDPYIIFLAGRTVGLIDKFKPLTFTATSEGVANGQGVQPARYVTTSRKRSKNKSLVVDFPTHGTPWTRFTPSDDAEEPPPPELLQDTMDPASAFLSLIRMLSDSASCAGVVQVYDGKRRYDVKFADLPRQMLHKTSYSLYSGEAKRCHASMTPLHGFKPGKRVLWEDTTIWFGHVLDGAPALPVRIDAQIELGAVRLHLVSARWLDQQASQ